jgi:hypothetical protein
MGVIIFVPRRNLASGSLRRQTMRGDEVKAEYVAANQ